MSLTSPLIDRDVTSKSIRRVYFSDRLQFPLTARFSRRTIPTLRLLIEWYPFIMYSTD